MAGMRNLLFAFTCIALGGLLFGFVIGVNSNVIAAGQLLCESGSHSVPVGTWTSQGYDQCYILGNWQKGFLSSLNIVGALIASLICFKWSDLLGRKLEVEIGAVLFFAGSMVAALSPVLWGIYAGFLVYGLGVGFAMHAAPVYIAEISPAEWRGALVSAKEACVVLGICTGFLCGVMFSGQETNGWRAMISCAAPIALTMAVGIFFVPDSPRFLLMNMVRATEFLDKESLMREAGKSLQFFRHAESIEEVEGEMQEIIGELEKSLGTEEATWTEPFRHRRLLQIGCGLVFLQQITGQPSILYFASNIFRSAGLGNFAQMSSLGVGVVKLLATLVAIGNVETYGRRSLLFVGIALMTVALALVGVSFLNRECITSVVSISQCKDADMTLPRAWGIMTVIGLMLYVSGYQLGFGPMSWVIISEIYPLRIRGAALSVAAIVNFSSNIAVTILQPVMLDAITPSGVFFTYMVLCVVSIVFVNAVVPETKGKTLEEIEAMIGMQKES